MQTFAYPTHTRSRPNPRYPDGRPYSRPRGRYADQEPVVDKLDRRLAVVDLAKERPTAPEFLRRIERELKIRFYQEATKRNYASHLRSLLQWFGNAPHLLTREDVRDYLEYLVDAGLESSTVGNHLSAIRTAFDKLCFEETTLGLASPRKPKQSPTVLSASEVQRLLESAVSLRDKLCLGLLYATGLRVSEVVKLTFTDLDFDRNLIQVRKGKGARDRAVPLPNNLRELLRQLAEQTTDNDYLFPAEALQLATTNGTNRRNASRHLSSRTVQRMMQRTIDIAKIRKHATPHTLRHTFATHSFEDGFDIRKIQKVLGHVSLETTTIYVRVAKPAETLTSPLDRLRTPETSSVGSRHADSTLRSNHPTNKRMRHAETRSKGNRRAQSSGRTKNVGRMRIHFKPINSNNGKVISSKVTLAVAKGRDSVFFTGIEVHVQRPGWISLTLPPLERWAEPLAKLSPDQRQRFLDAEFYEILQNAISKRFAERFP
ncbi:MAG: tyrosine-type recombinase/integrase [Pirellulaceae bacterium]